MVDYSSDLVAAMARVAREHGHRAMVIDSDTLAVSSLVWTPEGAASVWSAWEHVRTWTELRNWMGY